MSVRDFPARILHDRPWGRVQRLKRGGLRGIEIAKDFTEPFGRLWEGRAMPDDRLEEHFSLGLHNIRRAIEARLEASGIERQSLGDTSRGSKRAAPGMVIIDVGANNKIARVTFTREEVEDCTRAVEGYCVRSKIDHVVDELRR